MKVEITIHRNQLKYEVETETRKSSFFQVNGDKPELVDEAQLGTEQSDADYFTRKCGQGVDALVDVLHKFVRKVNSADVLGSKGEDTLPTDKVWKIELDFDKRRSIVTSSLASQCHKFVAYNVLYSWAVMTMPALAKEYGQQQELTRMGIQRLCYRKEAPVLEAEA